MLAALVVGSMLDAGIFSLPATFSRATGAMGAIIAWGIAGTGMLMLAFVFQRLALVRPDLDAGVYAYAEAGFGHYVGFLSALAFWAGSCVGNVSYFVLIKSTLGAFFPIFGYGNTLAAVLAGSATLWLFHCLILRGISGAARMNAAATAAKFLLLLMFVGIAGWAFDYSIFLENFWGYENTGGIPADIRFLDDYGYMGHAAKAMVPEANPPSLFSQVRRIMLVTVYVFVGIEGASVYSRLAKKRSDVGRATVLGFLVVLALFLLVTMLSYGVADRANLAGLRQPSVAGVIGYILGRSGLYLVSIALIITVLGAFLSWVMLAVEVLSVAAESQAMPAILTRRNKKSVPSAALWMTTLFIQALLLLTLRSDYAYGFILEMASSLCLLPYLLVGAYAVKLALPCIAQGRVNGVRDALIAIIATGYAALMLYMGGLTYLVLSSFVYAVGTVLFVVARRERGLTVFSGKEALLATLIVCLGCVAVYGIATGHIRM